MQLTKHVEDMRKNKKEMEGSVLDSSKDLINREVRIGIKHMDVVV